jgi:hypothetical protein
MPETYINEQNRLLHLSWQLLSQSLTANTYRGSLTAVSPLPAITWCFRAAGPLDIHRLTLGGPYSRGQAYSIAEYPVSIRLSQGANDFAHCMDARQWGV